MLSVGGAQPLCCQLPPGLFGSMKHEDRGLSGVQATKHHPSSVDLELIKRLAAATSASSLTSFLSREFDCISRDLAGELRQQALRQQAVIDGVTERLLHVDSMMSPAQRGTFLLGTMQALDSFKPL